MADITGHTEVKLGSEREFGLVFAGVFAVLAGVAWIYGSPLAIAALILAAGFLVLGQFAPTVLRAPNRIWFKFGMALHAIFLPVMMFAIFVAAFVPVGLVFRLRGKDLLHRNFDPEAPSYWVRRTEAPGSMKRQF